jgi:cyanophycin synthetase
MKILDMKAFNGRNIYSHRRCIKMDVDLEGYCEIPSKDIEDFNYNLIKLLPELNRHRCGIDEIGGFIKRLKEGTYLAHICEHIIIALQNIIGLEASFGRAREIEGDRYYIIYEYSYKNTGLLLGKMAVDLVNSLIKKATFNFDERLREIKAFLNEEITGPSTSAICDEARKRCIPITKLGDSGLYQLGYGKYGRVINATICDETSCVGVDISCDKLLTKQILDMNCIPVVKGDKVKNTTELLIKAEELGYPVVLKPQCGNQGNGVYVNIGDEKELLNTYSILKEKYEDIIIEKFIRGKDYRICIVDGEVVAGALRIPPTIIGDGISTVESLIKELNRDPRRGVGHEKPLTRVKVDAELIATINRQGYNMNYVLERGKYLFLRGNANLSTGGIAIDCTEEICSDNIEICKRAAKAVGLNICGIDICCSDISVPLYKDGAIVEVNAAPGIRMHHYPYEGKERNVAGAIVDMMFKDIPKTIPLVSITGTNGKTTTTRLVSYVLSLAGYNVGMTTTGGIYINDKCIEKGDTTGPDSAMAVLLNKDVDAVVLESARGGIVRSGLAYDLADVGVITNITDDHLGIDGVETLEDLADVKSLIVEAVKDDGYAVVNADDPVSVTVLDRIKSNIIMFSKNKDNKYLINNVKKGGVGIYCHEGYICVEKDEESVQLMKVDEIGIAMNGKLAYNIENAMAACAALMSLNIDYSIISQGLKNFRSTEELNPGRFNIYNLQGVTVVLDYGHNIEGYKSVLQGALSMKHNRLIGVIGVPGDRLNSNMIDLGRISANYFDYIYIKEDLDLRGRNRGEVAEFLKKGVLQTGYKRKNLEVIYDEKEALIKAIDTSRYGDVIVVFFEKYEPLVDIIKKKLESIAMPREIMA